VRSRLSLLALAAGAAAQTTPVALTFGADPVSDKIPPAEWKDYVVVMDDEDSNLLFSVNATTDYANGLGVYVSEELPPIADRLNPGQFLDFDAQSVIVINGVRLYSVALAQCYVRRGQTYYVSVFGKNVVGSATKPTVPYTIQVKKIPARIPLNSTRKGTVCDGHYMHYFWEIDSSFVSGGVRTHIGKVEGELDAAYMRYERCAGLASANLANVPLEGHGTPSGTVILPQGATPLDAGRYYVSVKGKPEICGEYSIDVQQISQIQLLASPAATLRGGGLVSLLASLVPAWLLGRAMR